jgi:hypothetical protein
MRGSRTAPAALDDKPLVASTLGTGIAASTLGAHKRHGRECGIDITGGQTSKAPVFAMARGCGLARYGVRPTFTAYDGNI